MAQLVNKMRYKPEGHGFDSRWCHWSFSLIILPTCTVALESSGKLVPEIFSGVKADGA